MEARAKKADQVASDFREYVPRGIRNSTGVVIDSASGTRIQDVNGKDYIDFAGGMGVQNVGHNHPLIVEAIKRQLDRYIQPSFHTILHEEYVTLAKRITEVVPGGFPKKVMLNSSGSEAVENAVKIARASSGADAIIAFSGAFHGRTLLAMSLTDKNVPYKYGFGPLAPEIYRTPFPYAYRAPKGMSPNDYRDYCIEALEYLITKQLTPDSVAAVLVEPVQGEGGFVVPPKGFLKMLAEVCSRYDILLIADEIQTGFGRTGRYFASEHENVTPDIMAIGKSLGAGLPIGAVCGRADVMDAPIVAGLGGTLSGSPVTSAAALAVLDVMEEEQIVERAGKLGEHLLKRFQDMQSKHKLIGDVRGLGAMVAIELVQDRTTKEPAVEATASVIKQCLDAGLIIPRGGIYDNVVRPLFPLTITFEELDSGLDILERAIGVVSANS